MKKVVDLGGGQRLILIHVSPGVFRRGMKQSYDYSGDWEEPVHQVRITRDFWLGETPVTQAQFLSVTGKEPSHFKGEETLPVEHVNWFDAREFCETLNERATPGWAFQLPTEAQWEYACRAGTETNYYTGDGENALRQAGWYSGNSESKTHPVKQKEPNTWGFYDMHGNVWEWCLDKSEQDAYKNLPDEAFDPVHGPDLDDKDAHRAVRGGTCWDAPVVCRSACRGWRQPGDRDWFLGFRVCLVRSPTGKAGKETEIEAAP